MRKSVLESSLGHAPEAFDDRGLGEVARLRRVRIVIAGQRFVWPEGLTPDDVGIRSRLRIAW